MLMHLFGCPVVLGQTGPSAFFPEKIILNGTGLYVGDEGGIWKRSLLDFFTSAREEQQLMELNIGPNPVQDIAWLSTNDLLVEKGMLSIFSPPGQLVHFEKLATFADSYPIGMSVLASGVYFIEIQDENGNRWIGQLLKE